MSIEQMLSPGNEVAITGDRRTEKSKNITRRRNILSCKRCYFQKRKCDGFKPVCSRCKNAKVNCEYFTRQQIDDRKHRKMLQQAHDPERVPNIELNPSIDESNFKLIVNSTGEYSKYLASGLFPFYKPSSNATYITNRIPTEEDKWVEFDFSTLVSPMSSISEIKSKIPEQKVANMLVDQFFDGIHPLIPIVDRQEFFWNYHRLWSDFNGFNDLNGLILMFAVFFTSSFSLQISNLYFTDSVQKEGEDHDFETIKQQSFQCVGNIRYLLRMNLAPSMSGLTALTLMYYVGSLNCIGMTTEVSSLVKYCEITGLHRNLSDDVEYTPMRSMLYCYILFLDTLTAYYNGIPSSVNKEIFETFDNVPITNIDLTILSSLSRFKNGMIWTDIIFELNKVKPITVEDVKRIEDQYQQCKIVVTDINSRILNYDMENSSMLKFLVTEGRMGLSKSGIMLNFLKSRIGHDGYDDLLIQSLILINESTLKVELGFKSNIDCIWFVRNSYPLQALSIVINDIANHPDREVNFKDLQDYTVNEEVDYDSGDIRRLIVELGVASIFKIEKLWPSYFRGRFKEVLQLKDEILN